jgi:hypothetical protein
LAKREGDQVARVLLLGAGFSRNWGGLLGDEIFEHLIAFPPIQEDAYLKKLLWRFSQRGGFEYALEEVQSDYSRQPEQIGPSLKALQDGISAVFEAMNDAFLQSISFEFVNDRSMQVKPFLAQFDAIYTLNQDILLERHYLPQVGLSTPERWTGGEIAGVRRTGQTQGDASTWATDIWVPRAKEELVNRDRVQPLYKLHGSSNWRDEAGGQLFVIGGNKARTIDAQEVLKWGFGQFSEDLSQGSSRLVVIGYSFRDDHVNQAIISAVRSHDLQFFVVDPDGSGVVRKANSSYDGAVYASSDLDKAFERGLAGASRRSLSETFSDDVVSFENLKAFAEG